MGFEFSGSFAHNIDPKGRATIPSAFREAFADNFVIALNNEFKAISLYPYDKWNEITDRLSRIPETDMDGMTYVRLVRAFAFVDQRLDAQGRVLLPAVLRQRAGIEKEITFLGMGRSIEIWATPGIDGEVFVNLENPRRLLDHVNAILS